MKRKVPTQQSIAFRAQLAMGGELVKALHARRTLADVGKELGLSTTMVSRIERQALAKIALAIRPHTRKLEHAL